MSVSHVIYGLTIRTNLPVPGVPITKDTNSADTLQLHLREPGGFPWSQDVPIEFFYSSQESDLAAHPILRVGVVHSGRFFVFLYSDGARFAIERKGLEVWADFPESYSLEDVSTYLLGPVMGFVLRLRGLTCLHASGIGVGDYAIALAGFAGSGKSTLAAAFGQSGFPVLSDDIVVLTENRGRFLVQPGYPRVNLWPDSARALFGTTALPRITPTWDKRYLALEHGDCGFASKPMPLKAIYILGAREALLTKPIVEDFCRNEAFITLVVHTYVNHLLDRNMRSRDFSVLAQLVATVPIRRTRPTANPFAVGHLCRIIAEDALQIPASEEPFTTNVSR